MSTHISGYISEIISGSFFRGSLVYLVGSVINAAIPMILLPILTRYLTPTDYGIVGTSIVFTQMFTMMLSLNAHGLIGRSHFDDDMESRSKLVSTSIMLSFILSIVLIAVFVLAGGPVEEATQFPSSWIPVLVFISLSIVIQNTYLNLVQARQESKRYIRIQIFSTLMNLGLSLFLVVLIGMDWQGRMIAILVSGAVIAALSLHGLAARFRLLRFTFDKESFHAILSFGVPLIPHFIGGWVMTMTPRLYLNNMTSVADTGLFSVGYNIASPVAMFVGAVQQAYWPVLFEKLSNPSVDKFNLARLLLLCAMSLPLLALAYGFAAYGFVPIIVGPKFYDAAEYVFWLSMAFAMQGVYFIFGNFIVYSKRTSLIAWRADFLAGISTLLFCPVLININGPIGAAQATMFAFLISTAGCFTASRKAYSMPWKEAALSFVSDRIACWKRKENI
jgi:O-antigen/teichoic acid export membrane protein